ncbi:hypothetical protein CEY04_04795 [Achromobacter sp. HZ28]|nr:hypothetical protein CEY05_04805 [Achromobacter sp. HZ34]OWT81218.1 hypothetical protein CEY04_04795 [Achromobacter sp. HZ28]
MLYSALLPVAKPSSIETGPLLIPAGTKVELELAVRFRASISCNDVATLTFSDLPDICDLIVLFELVGSRFDARASPDRFEKLADSVSHLALLTGNRFETWSLQTLTSPQATLFENGTAVVSHTGNHPALPLEALFSTWQARCVRERCDVHQGMIITWGSLTGVHPILADGHYRGEINGVVVECDVTIATPDVSGLGTWVA